MGWSPRRRGYPGPDDCKLLEIQEAYAESCTCWIRGNQDDRSYSSSHSHPLHSYNVGCNIHRRRVADIGTVYERMSQWTLCYSFPAPLLNLTDFKSYLDCFARSIRDSAGYPRSSQPCSPPASGRTSVIPCRLSASATRALVASFGQEQ